MVRTFISAALVALALPAAANADVLEGTYDLKLDTLYAVTQPGSRAPEGDAYCSSKFETLIGLAMSGAYKINTQTLIMSASATIESSDVSLFPLGISGRYAFMSDGVPKPLEMMHINRIIFNLPLDRSSQEGDVLLNGNDTYNCVLSNMAAN